MVAEGVGDTSDAPAMVLGGVDDGLVTTIS